MSHGTKTEHTTQRTQATEVQKEEKEIQFQDHTDSGYFAIIIWTFFGGIVAGVVAVCMVTVLHPLVLSKVC